MRYVRKCLDVLLHLVSLKQFSFSIYTCNQLDFSLYIALVHILSLLLEKKSIKYKERLKTFFIYVHFLKMQPQVTYLINQLNILMHRGTYTHVCIYSIYVHVRMNVCECQQAKRF